MSLELGDSDSCSRHFLFCFSLQLSLSFSDSGSVYSRLQRTCINREARRCRSYLLCEREKLVEIEPVQCLSHSDKVHGTGWAHRSFNVLPCHVRFGYLTEQRQRPRLPNRKHRQKRPSPYEKHKQKLLFCNRLKCRNHA